MFMRRGATWLFAGAVLASVMSVTSCGRIKSQWGTGRPRILVTIAPLACFARNVAGDHAEIKCLCTTKGPHEYESDVKDQLLVKDADLFFAVGLELDKFADRLQAESRNPNLRYTKLGDRLPEDLKLHADHDEDEKDQAQEKDGHHHEHGGEFDPHAWLGISQARSMVNTIRDELKTADAEHAADYDANAKKYLEVLDKLLADGKKQLAGKKDLKIITFHDSLAYFAKSFGVTIAAFIEMVPGAEAGASHLTRLVKLAKDEGIRVIAVEPQYPQKTSAKTLRDSLKGQGVIVQMVVVDPLETAELKQVDDPSWYETRMRKNIEDLAGALP
jgi:ABC-type Zn uptake system ZnuABC Zn-binding protein ZnuA